MSLRGRLATAEGCLSDALLWHEMQRFAKEVGDDPMELYEEAREMRDRYWHLARPCPDGQLDYEPVLRAMAEGEDLDYDELVQDAKRALRLWRRREARRRK